MGETQQREILLETYLSTSIHFSSAKVILHWACTFSMTLSRRNFFEMYAYVLSKQAITLFGYMHSILRKQRSLLQIIHGFFANKCFVIEYASSYINMTFWAWHSSSVQIIIYTIPFSVKHTMQYRSAHVDFHCQISWFASSHHACFIIFTNIRVFALVNIRKRADVHFLAKSTLKQRISIKRQLPRFSPLPFPFSRSSWNAPANFSTFSPKNSI